LRRWARLAAARRVAAARARREPAAWEFGVAAGAVAAGAAGIGVLAMGADGGGVATGAVARADGGPPDVPARFAWPGADGFFGAAWLLIRPGADMRVTWARGDECLPVTAAALSAAAFLSCPGGAPPGGPFASSGEQNTTSSTADADAARSRRIRLQGGRLSITDLRVPLSLPQTCVRILPASSRSRAMPRDVFAQIGGSSAPRSYYASAWRAAKRAQNISTTSVSERAPSS
jgi:hypothetical protein